MNLKEVDCGAGNWMDLAQYGDQWRAYVRAVKNLRVPSKEPNNIKILKSKPIPSHNYTFSCQMG